MSISPTYKPFKPKTNTIYRGDNLAIMRAMPGSCVDLIYIDPPFFTQKNYQNIWGDRESVADYEDNFFDGFHDTKDFFEKHIHSDAKGLKAYLEWMRVRLVEIHRILKPSGSFYLHLDYHAIHYIKVICDEIFGYSNFRNEIVWQRKTGAMVGDKGRRFSSNTDSILFYTKTGQYKFFPQYVDETPESVLKMYRQDDGDGRKYRLAPLDAHDPHPTCMYTFKGVQAPKNGWRWCKERMEEEYKKGNVALPKKPGGRLQRKLFLDQRKGTIVTNIWTDIPNLQGRDPERTGWPTQKPVALLERIINTSSEEGDLIFDCFAGCGTAMHAAHKTKRKWIGVDISPTAVKVNRDRLEALKAKVEVIDEHELPIEGHAKPSQRTKEQESAA